jgi:hypothetical protein
LADLSPGVAEISREGREAGADGGEPPTQVELDGRSQSQRRAEKGANKTSESDLPYLVSKVCHLSSPLLGIVRWEQLNIEALKPRDFKERSFRNVLGHS